MLTSSHAIDWSSVVEDNRDWIGRVVAARTGVQDVADDVIQEVSLAVTRSNSRPTRADEVAPWLCKIVVRQCALAVRNRVRQQRKLDGFQRTREAGDLQAGDPIFWLLHQECREIIRCELGAMDAPSRQLLIWKYLHGIGYEDIGGRLGVSRHVAEYRVIEARKELRRRLQARGIEEGDSP
jgi:RNA polymerase sigma factor (sigma-70 family)